MVINRTTFDVCTPSSFGEVKAHIHTSIYKFSSHVGCDGVIMSSAHQDNHPGVVINRAQFGVCRPSSFRSVTKKKPNIKRKNPCFIVLDCCIKKFKQLFSFLLISQSWVIEFSKCLFGTPLLSREIRFWVTFKSAWTHGSGSPPLPLIGFP